MVKNEHIYLKPDFIKLLCVHSKCHEVNRGMCWKLLAFLPMSLLQLININSVHTFLFLPTLRYKFQLQTVLSELRLGKGHLRFLYRWYCPRSLLSTQIWITFEPSPLSLLNISCRRQSSHYFHFNKLWSFSRGSKCVDGRGCPDDEYQTFRPWVLL